MERRTEMFNRAMDFYGLKEVPGEENNPMIVQMFKDIGHGWNQSDETAWCSAFINWVAWSLRLEHTGKLNARSWLEIGDNVQEPLRGHLVIYWRERIDSWKGHVGIFVSKRGSMIYTLGGNQDNRVCIKAYAEHRVLAYRELRAKYMSL